MKQLALLLAILLCTIGCENQKEKIREGVKTSSILGLIAQDDELNFEELEPPRTQEPAAPPKQKHEEKVITKIIKDGSIIMEVDSLSSAKLYIDSLVIASNAYYENETFNASGRQKTYSLRIRIPNYDFDKFISLLEVGSGNITSKSIHANDVTSEYVDLKIRLDNNRAYLDQYRQLLKKAKSMKDILEIQEESRKLESKIDAQIGRMKYINDQVKYSTLNLNVYQNFIDKVSRKRPGFLTRIWKSIGDGFSGLVEFVVAVVALWPVVLILSLLLWLFRRYRKKTRQG